MSPAPQPMCGPLRKRDSNLWAREADEHYVEPDWVSERLFEEEKFFGQIWDPCCGFGRIPNSAKLAGYSAYASDIVDRGYGGLCETANFLKCNDDQASPNIVCNPPFNIVKEFALHALSLGNTKKVAMVFPTARLNAAHWLHGTPLARVWLMTPRPSMPPGHTITSGEKPGGGKVDFCWLVWAKGYSGDPELRWLRRDA
jgi:hypothetical protein